MQKDINPFLNDEYDLTKKMLFNHLNSKSSCSIGVITAINSNPVSANVQPLINYFDKIEGFTKPDILEYIPVMQLINSVSSIRLPLNIGDIGILLWFDREVYSNLNNSSLDPTNPKSGALNNESACVFIPFLQKFSKALPFKTSGIDIVSSNKSLLTELLSTMTNIYTTLNNITSLLSDLTTFCTAVVASGATVPPTYSTNIAAAATALSASLISITSSIATTTTNISTINSDLTIFKGEQ